MTASSGSAAAQGAGEAVATLREIPDTADGNLAQLAKALNNLDETLVRIREFETAQTATAEVVAIYRQLTEIQPQEERSPLTSMRMLAAITAAAIAGTVA